MRHFGITSPHAGGIILGTALLTGTIAPVRAEHFDIHLTLRTASGTTDAGWDTTPPEGGVNPRRTAHAAAGEDITLEWRIRDEYPHGPMKQVAVRIFARAEDAAGQKRVPEPAAFTLLDMGFVADFLPDHSGHGRLRFRASRPGSYLVRLETANTLLEHGHEHFSALDLVVEPARAGRLPGFVGTAASRNSPGQSHPGRRDYPALRSPERLLTRKP